MALLLLVMALITFVEVLARFVFHVSIAFLGELVPNLFVWMTFLGIAAAEEEGAHLGIPLLPKKFPHLAPLLERVGRFARSIFFLILLFYGSRSVYQSWTSGERTPFGIPAGWITLAIPVGALLTLWVIIRRRRQG